MVDEREQAAREWACKYYFNENQYAFDLLSDEDETDDNLILPMAMLLKAFTAGAEHEAKRKQKEAHDELCMMSCSCLKRLQAIWNPAPPKEESE